MKKLLSLLTALSLALPLCACAQPSAVPETTVPATTVSAEPISFADYEYRCEEGRDRDWEEDIVYLAKAFLGELIPSSFHPLLTDREVFDSVFRDGKVLRESRNFYNAELHAAFTQEIQNLLLQIPQKQDVEILFGLQKAVALLGDLHTGIRVETDAYFPLLTEPLEADGELGLYVTFLPGAYGEGIGARLTAVNGVPVGEIVDALRPALSLENEYDIESQLFHFNHRFRFSQLQTLQMAGVVAPDAQEADFTLLTRDGVEMTVRLSATDWNRLYDCEPIVKNFAFLGLGIYQQYEKNYYWEAWPEDSALYIRFNRMMEDASYRMETMARELYGQMEAAPGTEKLIVDFRGNPGGYVEEFYKSVVPFLRDYADRQIYVLIDSASTSGAVEAPAIVCQAVDGITLVGTPTAQSPQFFASAMNAATPNYKLNFSISKMHFNCWEGFEGDALMPDITIRQTLEDYMNGVDTVLEFVKAR